MAEKTAIETIKGIIEDNGGTTDAETIVPALEDLGEVIAAGGGGGGGGTADYNVRLIAADAQAAQAMTQLGMTASATYSPAQMAEDNRYLDSRSRLCWIFENDEGVSTLECAPFELVASWEANMRILYAQSNNSTATGILGVSESWDVSAN